MKYAEWQALEANDDTDCRVDAGSIPAPRAIDKRRAFELANSEEWFDTEPEDRRAVRDILKDHSAEMVRTMRPASRASKQNYEVI